MSDNITQITPSAGAKIITAVQRVLAEPITQPENSSGDTRRKGASDGEFRLTGNRSKGGMYTANPCTAQTTGIDSSASGSLTETTVMVADTSSVVYLMNKQEFGSSSHSLLTTNTPKTFKGRRWGTDTDGTAIYLIDQC